MNRYVTIEPLSTAQLVQILIFIVGFVATVYQLRRTAAAARAANLLSITKNHRELWTFVFEDPSLESITDPARECQSMDDLTLQERLLVNFILLHIASAYALEKSRLLWPNKSVERDVGELLSLPVFRTAWAELGSYHPKAFQKYANKSIEKFGMRGRSAIPATNNTHESG